MIEQLLNLINIPRLSITAYVIAALVVITGASLWYGHHEAANLRDYKATIQAEIAAQVATNKIKEAEAQQTTKELITNYEKRIANIKSLYATQSGSVLNGPHTTTPVSPTASTTDGTPADVQFVEKCTLTTLQLVTLQEWLVKQIAIDRQ